MPKTEKPQRRLITVKDAAEALSVTPWTVYKLLGEEGAVLKSVYQGRRRYVTGESFDAYLDGLPTTAPDAGAA